MVESGISRRSRIGAVRFEGQGALNCEHKLFDAYSSMMTASGVH